MAEPIYIKSPSEIELMRQAGKITAGARTIARQAVHDGISTKQIDRHVHDFITKNGAYPTFLNYNGFPGSACVSGELFEALLEERGDETVAGIADFYDYLEIQPRDNNRFLLESPRMQERYPQIRTEEDLLDLNRRIVKLGEQLSAQRRICSTSTGGSLNWASSSGNLLSRQEMFISWIPKTGSTAISFRTGWEWQMKIPRLCI